MLAHPIPQVAVIGGGSVGAAILNTLTHRGIAAVLLEAAPDFALGASGTNSGIVHTGFDSTPNELETELILRAARIRPAVLKRLDLTTLDCGAVLIPRSDSDRMTIAALAENSARNGVNAHIRASDGALVVPGEAVCDPVEYTRALITDAQAAGGTAFVEARVESITPTNDGLIIGVAGRTPITVRAAVNAAGLHSDEIARMVSDDSFEIYPRKGEFFVFELPNGATLTEILLPVPTPRTKGVLVFPTLDGKVVAGPTAVDLHDKNDWTVRPEARGEILAKAETQFPALRGLSPIASYAGLRPAGRDCNYVIKASAAQPRLINVAAIRSTGLTSSLGIADYVSDLIEPLVLVNGTHTTAPTADTSLTPVTPESTHTIPSSPSVYAPKGGLPWWKRTASFHGLV